MTRTEKAAQLRKELKAHGWTSRDISVRAKSCTYSSAIDVVVKRADIDIGKVKELAMEYESISRCEYSGEILSGGNTYVEVRRAYELAESMADAIKPACIKALKEAGAENNVVVEVDGTEFTLSVSRGNNRITVWDKNDSPFFAGFLVDVERDAGMVARAIVSKS